MAVNKRQETAEYLAGLATKYGIRFDPQNETPDVWFLVRKNRKTNQEFIAAYIMSHQAHMRIAHGEGVEFTMQSLVAQPNCYVFLVTAKWRDRTATSVGEAYWTPEKHIPGAIQADKRPYTTNMAYVASMAEKRGKDRALQQVLGLADVYSEDEAEDFRYDREDRSRGGPASSARPKKDQGGTPQGGPTGRGPLGGGRNATVQELGGPRALLDAISAGYDPELDPFKFEYKFGKHKGKTFAHVYLNEWPDREGSSDYTTWMASKLNPGAPNREKPAGDFEIKMWQAHLWLMTRVDKKTGEVRPLEQCKFGWATSDPQPQAQPSREATFPGNAPVRDDLNLPPRKNGAGEQDPFDGPQQDPNPADNWGGGANPNDEDDIPF